MRTEWSDDGMQVKIYGDHAAIPLHINTDVIEHFGGSPEEAFHAIHRLNRAGMLPKPSAHPHTLKNIQLAEENQQRGERHWKYGTKYRGNWKFWGFYYEENGEAVFPDLNERV